MSPSCSDALPQSSCGPLLPPTGIILQRCVIVQDVAPFQMLPASSYAPPTPCSPSQPALPTPLSSARRTAVPSLPLSHPVVPLPSPRCAPFPPLPTHLPAPRRCPPPTMPRAEALAPGMPRATSRLSSRRASRSGFSRRSLFPWQSLRPPATTSTGPERKEGAGLFPACSAGGLAPPHPPLLSSPPTPALGTTSPSVPRAAALTPAGHAPRLGPAPGCRCLRANSVARTWERSRAPRSSWCDAQDSGARGRREASGAARAGPKDCARVVRPGHTALPGLSASAERAWGTLRRPGAHPPERAR